jgi:hypothetical protein
MLDPSPRVERRQAPRLPFDDPSRPDPPIADFSPQSGSVTGVDVRYLPPGTQFVVETGNSHYHFEMLEGGGEALVQGGHHLPQATIASIEGSTSTSGGALPKTGWVGRGLCLVLSAGGKRIVTSRVRSITIDSSSA